SVMIVFVAVAHAAAEENQRVVQQSAFSVRRRFELIQEIDEQSVMVGIQLGKPVHVGLYAGVMREFMESVFDVGGWKNRIAEFVSQHQSGDARDLGAECQHLEIEKH